MSSLISVTLAKIAAILTSIAMALGFSVVHPPVDSSSATTTISTTTSPVTLPGNNGTQVTSVTRWRSISPDGWKIIFSNQEQWSVNVTNDGSGKPALVAVAGEGISIYVSKNSQVAEPSDKKFTTSTRTIDGKSVEVHTYLNPSKGNAYYMYFTLPEGNDSYSFSIQSTTSSMQTANDFIALIHS